jgi:hypothetical protein
MVGCDLRPVAPELNQHERTYHNAEEGFRFEAPSGWSRHAVSSFPPGPQREERLWVKYKRLTDNRPTFFRVSFIDLPESASVAQYLGDRPAGPENWRLASEKETVDLDGVAATRYRFTGSWAADVMVKEVVAVRRGHRWLFFTGIYPADDTSARRQIRETLASIRWDRKPEP